MREYLRRLWRRLRLGSETTSLGWSLAAINVVIVALAVGGIAISAVGMLRNLADEQGKARVQLAGAIAREDLRRLGEDALAAARTLADRPPLQRALGQRAQARAAVSAAPAPESAIGPPTAPAAATAPIEKRSDAVSQILRRYCEAGGMDACAIFEDKEFVAQAGAPLPWAEILTASAEQGETFLAAPSGAASPVAGAVAAFVERPDRRIFVARLLDAELAATLSGHVGLPVRLIGYRAFSAAPVDDFTPLHSAALADGRSAVQRVAQQDLYASSFPIYAPTGEAIALIETRLPAVEIDATTGRLVKQLLLTALVLALIAMLAGVVLGQFVAGPVRTLTRAAVRLGAGDFSTSIPPQGPAEVGALARTMEDMRRNLVDLTGTLRRHEAEAQSVLSGIVEGVYAVDKNRIIRYLNPQAAKLLGVTAEQAVGRFCGDVLKPCSDHGRRPCEFNCPILRARLEGRSQAMERLQARGAEPRSTVITSSGMAEGLQVQVIRDETELEAVRRARDSVLANISHEFRTPLAAQLASIELLRAGINTLPIEQQRELVLSLERGTLRLTQLIDNLLESVRIESGQLGIRKQGVALAATVEDARALIGALLAQRGQQLEVSIPEDLPFVEGDGPRLTQVFVNLIANASKFAPEGSTIRVGAEARGGGVAAWVEDEGPGLPAGDAASIFDRFHRGPDAEPVPGGLGLGLWIVKSIVERHGGTIAAERTAQHRTRFSITLPAEALA